MIRHCLIGAAALALILSLTAGVTFAAEEPAADAAPPPAKPAGPAIDLTWVGGSPAVVARKADKPIFSMQLNFAMQTNFVLAENDEDFKNTHGGDDLKDAGQLRYVRGYLKGFVGSKKLTYVAMIDFAAHKSTYAVPWAFIQYAFSPDFDVRIGQQVEPTGIDALTRPTWNMFGERTAETIAFTFRYNLGVRVRKAFMEQQLTLFAGAFMQSDNRGIAADARKYSLVARLVFAPLMGKEMDLHTGVSIAYRDNFAPSYMKGIQPPIRPLSTTFVSFSGSVRHQLDINAEFAMMMGPIFVQSEFFTSQIDIGADDKLEAWGFYLEVGFFILPGRRAYHRSWGRFKKVVPEKSIDDGGLGALQVSLRFGNTDFDEPPTTGSVRPLTYLHFGVNWYLNIYLRLHLSYMWAQPGADGTANLFLFMASLDI
jgi:phosphate-selective porin OprO/OprP